MLPGKQRQDPVEHVGKCTEYRATERWVGLKGPCRTRRSRKSEYRNGNEDRVLTGEESNVEKHGSSLDRRKAMAAHHEAEDRPVYWKLLQKVLANLGLTEEQWMMMYVGE